MNIYILELVYKWFAVLTLSIASLFGFNDTSSNHSLSVENDGKTKNLQVTTEIIPYETEKVYSDELLKGEEKIVKQGKTGVAYIINGEREIAIEPTTEKIEVGTKENETFTGKMTGYGADCIGCTGNLSCKTKAGKTFSLSNNGQSYHDSEYGNVRILAAALDKFPCGTIIKVTHSKLGVFNAIVLDTGTAMKAAWSRGEILMDLAYVSQKDSKIRLTTTNHAKYEVLRWGW
jgi:3D (Asp-Asp-Asp) domain-containing protein